jgi:hypothetical protein
MRDRSKPPFQARVASVAIVTTVAVLVAACVSFMLQQWSVSRQQARLEQATLASVIAAAAAPDMSARDAAGMDHDLAGAAASRALVDVRLVDPQGRTVAYFAAPVRRAPESGPVRIQTAPMIVSGRSVGAVVLRAHEPTLVALLPRFLALTGALFFGASGSSPRACRAGSPRRSSGCPRRWRRWRPAASSGRSTPTWPTTTSSRG